MPHRMPHCGAAKRALVVEPPAVVAAAVSARRCRGALTLRAGAPRLRLFPSGATCEVVLAPCAPGPCRNGGECKESKDYESFSCACPVGWQGEPASPGGAGTGRVGVPGSLGICRARGSELPVLGEEPAGCRALPALDVCIRLGPTLGDSKSESPSFPGRPQRTTPRLRRPRSCGVGAELTAPSPPPPGQTCEIDINECVKSPCRAGASCQNTNGGYRCHCQAGYTGRNCETDVDDCRPSEWPASSVHLRDAQTCFPRGAQGRELVGVGWESGRGSTRVQGWRWPAGPSRRAPGQGPEEVLGGWPPLTSEVFPRGSGGSGARLPGFKPVLASPHQTPGLRAQGLACPGPAWRPAERGSQTPGSHDLGVRRSRVCHLASLASRED